MTRKYTSHSSSLFLMELIFAIFFFMIASAVCVQLFVKSHQLSTEAENLSYAAAECANAAELILAADSLEAMESCLLTAYPDATQTHSGESRQFILPYRDSYKTLVMYELQNGLLTATISFQDADTSHIFYTLTLDHYLPKEG